MIAGFLSMEDKSAALTRKDPCGKSGREYRDPRGRIERQPKRRRRPCDLLRTPDR